MTSGPSSGRAWAMLVAPVELFTLLPLEANCIPQPPWSGAAGWHGHPAQNPLPKSPLLLPARGTMVCTSFEIGLLCRFSEHRLTWFLEGLGQICHIPSLKAKLWIASPATRAVPAVEEGDLCARHSGQLSSPAHLNRFYFSLEIKQEFRPDLLHM